MTIRQLMTQVTRARQMARNVNHYLRAGAGSQEGALISAYLWSGHLIVEAQKVRRMIQEYAKQHGVRLPK